MRQRQLYQIISIALLFRQEARGKRRQSEGESALGLMKSCSQIFMCTSRENPLARSIKQCTKRQCDGSLTPSLFNEPRRGRL